MNGLEMNEIWVEIEKLREYLYDIASKKGMRSPETIRASQRLDARLNEYNYLRN